MKPQTIEELEKKHSEEIADIKHSIGSMRQQLDSLTILLNESNKEREEQRRKIDRLIRLLEGDPIDPMSGLVNRLLLIEKFVNSMKSLRQYLMGNIAAAVFIIGFLGGVIAFFYKAYEFFSNK
jgi:hypothetical protein